MPQNPKEDIDQLVGLEAEEVQEMKLDEELPDAVPVGASLEFQKHFFGRAGERPNTGEERARPYAILRLVGMCYGFATNFSATGNPFIPRYQFSSTERGWCGDDLTEEDLLALEVITSQVTSPELKCRLADVLWERDRGHQFGHMAAAAYAKLTSKIRSTESWGDLLDVAERGLVLHAKLGRKTQPYKDHVQRIVDIALSRSGDGEGVCWGRLVSMVWDIEGVPLEQFAELAERRSELEGRGGSVFNDPAYYMNLAADCWRRAKKEEQSKRCREGYGDLLLAKARAGKEKWKAGYSANWTLKALEVLRQNRSDPGKIEAVYKEMLELQQESRSEMQPIGIPEPQALQLKENFNQATAEVKNSFEGIPFEQALLGLAFRLEPLDPDELAKEREERPSDYFASMIPVAAIERDGRPQGTAQGEGLGGELSKEDLYKHLWQEASMFRWPSRVGVFIEPARETILEEHRPGHRDFYFLIMGNPFIAPGHHMSYLRGIHAGFYDDWLVVPGLLLPALEASLRMVMKSQGVITSKLEADGIQMEHDLGWLLTHPKLPDILGEQMVFDLRGILIEKFGHNLRNAHAHGLMVEGERYDTATRYFWWQVIHLLAIAAHMVHRERCKEQGCEEEE